MHRLCISYASLMHLTHRALREPHALGRNSQLPARLIVHVLPSSAVVCFHRLLPSSSASIVCRHVLYRLHNVMCRDAILQEAGLLRCARLPTPTTPTPTPTPTTLTTPTTQACSCSTVRRTNAGRLHRVVDGPTRVNGEIELLDGFAGHTPGLQVGFRGRCHCPFHCQSMSLRHV